MAVSKKKPIRDAKWHAMMKRRREIMSCPKKKINRDCIETSHGLTWVRGHKLGRGSFGSVFYAKTKTKTKTLPVSDEGADDSCLPSEIAVKSAEKNLSSSLKTEKEILCNLKGSVYVIKCYGGEITKPEEGEKVFYNILLEYCSGGSLHDRIKKWGTGLPELEVRRYTGDIVRGLYYIHNHGYVHCDIKPENILLVPNKKGSYTAKIADFGLAKKWSFGYSSDEEEEDCSSRRGTYPYMSPELVRDKILEPPADIWALGCVVTEMMSGKPIWGFEYNSHFNSNVDDLLGRIAYSPELPEIPSGISEEGKDFLQKCLVKDSDDRWPAETLSQHPFVSRKRLIEEENKLYGDYN